MATPNPKTTAPKLDDLDAKRAKLIADSAEVEDLIRRAEAEAQQAEARRSEAEGRKAAILREAARLQAEAEALAGDHGPVVRELAELTTATRGTVEQATRTLSALHEAMLTLDRQTTRGAFLTQQARSLGADVAPWPEAMDTRPYVTRTENLEEALGQYLRDRADRLR